MPPLFNGARWQKQKNLEAYVKNAYDIFALLDGQNKTVLELGCGFGLMLVSFGMFGSKRLIGVDIAQENQEGFQKLSAQFPDLDLNFQLGDWLNLPHEPESFDVVLMYESISHIRDTDIILSEIHNVLKPNGVLFISDGNNDLSVYAKIISHRKWKHAETETAQSSQVSRSVDRLSYRQARANMIKEAYPHLAPDVVQEFSEKTRGLFGQEILDYVAACLVGKKNLPQASFSYRNPITGEFHEKSFNPLKLSGQLQALGFQSELLRPIFPTTPLTANPRDIVIHFIGRPIAFWARFLPLVLVPFVTPNFWIRATKK